MTQTTTKEQPIDPAVWWATARDVLTRPAQFFQEMPRTGGFLAPALYVAVVSLLSAGVLLLRTLPSGPAGYGTLLVGSFLWTPVVAVAASFVGAGLLYGIWVALGSHETYETAYRCAAAVYTLSPILALLGWVPYLDLLGVAASVWLLTCASVTIHHVARPRALWVFGSLALILTGMNLVARSRLETARTHALQQNAAVREGYAQQAALLRAQTQQMQQRLQQQQQHP